METIIVIPARGNSKGIKKKNLINFCGKPLLYWTIIQAKKSKFKKNIYVSSENEKILKFSKKLGVNTIKRPLNLSKDDSSSESAIKNVLENLNFKVDNIIFLQATSPLRKPGDINKAYDKLISSKSDSIFSCHKAEDYFDIWSKKKSKYIPLTIDFKSRKPRQLFKETHVCQNGSMYLFKRKILNKYNNRLGGKINVYEMDEWQSLQLDDIKQMNTMELLFKKKLKKFYV
jgi:CMP-N,N'-diacetyllegionaminic acid synthase